MLKPLADRVLIEPTPAIEKTKSGIIIPTAGNEEKSEGTVIALGTGIVKGKKYDFSVKIGDKVLFGKYAGEEIEIEEKKYKVVREDEILGIL